MVPALAALGAHCDPASWGIERNLKESMPGVTRVEQANAPARPTTW